MKTSTLCLGCLSLTLLAAGLAGVVDASSGPRPTGEHALSPLAGASDAIATWITPSQLPTRSMPIAASKDRAKRAAPTRVIARDAAPAAPESPSTDCLEAAAPVPVGPPTDCPVACSYIVVAPEWDEQEWKTLNAESFKSLQNLNIQLKQFKKPACPSPSGSCDGRKPDTRQRA